MTNITIDINCEHAPWHEALPETDAAIKTACRNAIAATGLLNYAEEVEVSVLLADNASIASYNKQYRDKDKPTNVLSFPGEEWVAGEYADAPPFVMLGDIVLALEIIQQEADDEGISLQDHLSHLVVHGTLHLLGYDHIEDEDAQIMESLEIEVLAGLGIENPYE